MSDQMQSFEIDRSRYDDPADIKNKFVAEPGLSEELVRHISKSKNEPEWMLKKRLDGLKLFLKTPIPKWGPDLSSLDLDNIIYYVDPDMRESTKWEDLPEEIRRVAERIGIPEAEKRALGGAGFQFDSDMMYHNLKKEWDDQGVIFENMDVAVQKDPELVQKYFMTKCIPVNDHKFIMLHAAVWSSGTFIIADKESEVQYIEGCSSPVYAESALHAGCVEIFVHEGARVRYTSVENWSKNTFNLNTKRAIVEKHGTVEWLNGNLGCLTGDSKVFTNPKGPIDIRSLNIGDKIYTWDKKINQITKSKVKNIIFSGDKKVYKLKAGGREIEASGNHPFLALVRKKNHPSHKKGFFHQEWVPLEKLGI